MSNDQQIVIRAQDLTRYFGDFLAVDRVSFTVHPGEVVGYLGPNGSGKTTTIRMLLGLLLPTSGSAHVLGFDATSQSEQVRAQVGYMSQKFSLYQELTVIENLSFYAGVYGIRERARLDAVLELVGLQGLRKQRVQQLSVGWRQRLALAAAIVHQPQLLFLDEPTSGVDPKARRAFWDLIYQLVEEGVTALVTTHYMDEAEYCGRIGIMRSGQLLALDTPSALKEEAMPGLAWDIRSESGLDSFAAPGSQTMIELLNTLQDSPLVLRAGLLSDHLRAVTPDEVTRQILERFLAERGFEHVRVKQAEPTLEDVFQALAARN